VDSLLPNADAMQVHADVQLQLAALITLRKSKSTIGPMQCKPANPISGFNRWRPSVCHTAQRNLQH
jgi:hypothetical protein